jgi:ubiquinol-cytochrome c reductase cytochrome c1 subunit
MPHALGELQGLQERRAGETSLVLSVPGKLSDADYRNAVNDLVTFLVYLAEPAQLERRRLGFWVIGFLSVLLVLAYLLKKEYWKDVH